MKPDGKLIITTPNAASLYWAWLRLRKLDFVNPEHTCWFDEATLAQLLARHGFEITERHYVMISRTLGALSVQNVIGSAIEAIPPERIGRRNLVVVSDLAIPK